jgi:hypothetical protein
VIVGRVPVTVMFLASGPKSTPMFAAQSDGRKRSSPRDRLEFGFITSHGASMWARISPSESPRRQTVMYFAAPSQFSENPSSNKYSLLTVLLIQACDATFRPLMKAL